MAGGVVRGELTPAGASVFNHVGLCVADRDKSLRFYEELLGFKFWREIEMSDEGAAKPLQLDGPIGIRATYLIGDGLVLELIDYSKRDVRVGSHRVMDEVGLTHLSLSVSDLASVLARVESLGGSLVQDAVTEHFAMIRDPDGQLIELLPESWVDSLPPRP